jgi:WD40 repeat protein
MNRFVQLLSSAKWSLPFFLTGGIIMAARLAIRPGDNVTAFEVFSNGELLATGTSTGEVTIWSVPALKKLASVDVPCEVLAFDASGDGKKLCYGGKGGAIGLLRFDKKTLKLEKSAALPAIHIESIRFSQDEKYLIASSEADAKAYLLKPNLELVTWMFQPGNAVKNAIVSEKNNYIAHAGQQFWIWDLDKVVHFPVKNPVSHSEDSERQIARCTRRQLGGNGAPEIAPFSDYRRILFAGAFDPSDNGRPVTVALYDLGRGSFEPILRHLEPITGIAVSPGGEQFAVAFRDGKLRVYSVDTRRVDTERLFSADIPYAQRDLVFPILRIQFVAGKTLLLCLTVDRRLFVWDYRSGQVRQLA